MSSLVQVRLAQHDWQLLADRGLYWPSHDTLFVADTHFGKDASFRAGGIPVPRGANERTMARISAMLQLTSAGQLVILGDMFHTRSSLSDDVRDSMERFFDSHCGVLMTLVLGNHDVHVGRLPTSWPVDVIPPGRLVDGVMMTHHPMELTPDADLQLCGHLHPAIEFGNPSERLRCFYLSQQQLVLPAVGEFTGAHRLRRKRDDRVWMIVDGDIVRYEREAELEA